jgi:hypothetical protein
MGSAKSVTGLVKHAIQEDQAGATNVGMAIGRLMMRSLTYIHVHYLSVLMGV